MNLCVKRETGLTDTSRMKLNCQISRLMEFEFTALVIVRKYSTIKKGQCRPLWRFVMFSRSLSPVTRVVWERIDSLNLDPIKIKLMDSKEGKGWTREFADRIEVQYKQFLKLASLQDSVVVPNKYIDDFWHNHILDTRKYEEDCRSVFGFFLHHFPYLGMRGEEDRRNLADSFSSTLERVKEVFGPESDWSLGYAGMLDSSICKSCGTSDCAPDPSCGSDPSPGVGYDILRNNQRPALLV